LRIALAALALIACTALTAAPVEAKKAATAVDWTKTVLQTPAGGFRMGNPKAKVTLVEYGSMTCPHCREFEETGTPKLVAQYVKTGKVSFEFRNYIRDPFDMAAALVARCDGSKRFFPLTRALYEEQPTWVQKIRSTPKDQLDQLQALEAPQLVVQAGKFAGFDEWAEKRGIPRAKSAQCLADTAAMEKLSNLTDSVSTDLPNFPGVPTFVLNGKMVEFGNVTAEQVWPTLESKLRAALGERG
jgi:protein-disulfide isomerase